MTQRYSAKLLFQFRVDLGAKSGKRRVCEERIIVFSAASPSDAIAKAKKKAIASEHSWKNDAGDSVYFEFVGIMDILRHGPEMRTNEVWYEIRERLLPRERRAALLPTRQQLERRAAR